MKPWQIIVLTSLTTVVLAALALYIAIQIIIYR